MTIVFLPMLLGQVADLWETIWRTWRSSRCASPSSQRLWSAGFFCGRPCDMELVTREFERSGHQQRLLQAFTEDVFIFSLPYSCT